MNICFNCQAAGAHMSKDCPERQNFTRCPHCDNVCVRPSSHKIWCENKEFVSSSLNVLSTVHQSTELFSLRCSIEDIYVMDGSVQKNITTGPMFLPNLNLIMMKKDSHTIVFFTVRDSDNGMCLSISDGLDIDLFCLKLNASSFVVNSSIRVRENGHVEFRGGPERPITRSPNLHLKVRSENEPFSVHILKYGSFDFELNGHLEQNLVDHTDDTNENAPNNRTADTNGKDQIILSI